jgi:predicted metallo-beta-lactamase superfamily hydrolase
VKLPKHGRFENYIANVYKDFEILIWEKLEKINWSDLSRNKEVLHTVCEERGILHKIKKRGILTTLVTPSLVTAF